MMAIFRIGDHVQCVWDRRRRGEPLGDYLFALWRLRGRRRTYVVTGLIGGGFFGQGLFLDALPPFRGGGAWNAAWFRKVQPAFDAAAWLATADGREGPLRDRAMPVEKVKV